MHQGKAQVLASNVDLIFVVTSANQEFNLARLEQYYIIAKDSGIPMCFVLSKKDLPESSQYIEQICTRFSGVPVVATSLYDPHSINQLFEQWVPGQTAVFLGSSGVGKSSLINQMRVGEKIATQSIRTSDDKGRHTTTSRQIYTLRNGRFIIDTPGLREVGIDGRSETVDDLFPLIAGYVQKCRFSNCTHSNEPGCRLLEAIIAGEITKEEYLRYLKLKNKEKERDAFKKGKAFEKEELAKKMKKRR